MSKRKTLNPGWRQVTLEEVAENSTKATKDPEGDGFERYIVGKNIPADGGCIQTWSTVGDGLFGSRIRTIIEAGDVICTTRGPNLRVARATFRCLGAHTNFVLRSKSEKTVLQDYLALVIDSEGFQGHLVRNFRGSVNLFVNWSDAAKYEFALPPVGDQEKIVELMDSLTRQAHALQACTRSAELVARCEGRHLLQTSGGAMVALGQLAEVVGGVTKDRGRTNSDEAVSVPYLRVANVLRGRIDLNDVAMIDVEPKVLERLRLQKGDVLLNEGGDRDKLGRGWVWDDQIADCIHQNHVFHARVHDDRFPPLLVAWMANYGNARWFEDNGRQSTNLASISMTTVRQFPVPLITEAERHRFLDIIESQLKLLESLDDELRANKLLASTLREHLLTGDLDVR